MQELLGGWLNKNFSTIRISKTARSLLNMRGKTVTFNDELSTIANLLLKKHNRRYRTVQLMTLTNHSVRNKLA